jgi:hypothetical protein
MATVWIIQRHCEEGTLPQLCLRCGAPTTLLVEKDVFGTLLFGAPATFFLSIVWGWESAKIRVPMCRRHRHHWRNRRLFLLPVFLASVAVMGFCVGVETIEGYVTAHTILDGRLPLVFFGGVLLFLVSVAFGLSGIQAKDVHESRVQLACISPAFIHAYAAQCAAEKEQAERPEEAPNSPAPE